MSTHNLTKGELEIVQLGLKFVPDKEQNEEDIRQFKTDLKQFQIKLRREEHFRRGTTGTNADTEHQTDDIQSQRKDLFSNPSRWVPDSSDDRLFQIILDNIGLLAESPMERVKNFKYNVTMEQRKAIQSLRSNKDLVLKEADKGGATVLLDKKDYHSKMYELLEDTNTYEKITGYSLNTTKRKVIKFVEDHKDILTPKEKNYLHNFEMRTAYIYGLPKIHKCGELKKKVEQELHNGNSIVNGHFSIFKIPFRPIVSGRNCPISRLSELLKVILRPFEQRIEHLMRDSTHFIGTLQPNIPRKNTKMIAIDIVALYPSITNTLGTEAIEHWMDTFPSLLERFPKDFVMELLSIVQENVYLTFNEDTYRQVEGTAMGKSHAPPYANLVVAHLIKNKLYPNLEQQFGLEAKQHVQDNLKLFLDDGFMFLDEGILESSTLLTALNEMDPIIKFTMETSKTELPFLDVLVKLEDDPYNASLLNITTDLYSKPTDSFSYFHFRSCAPRHVKRNIPYNLARRIATIVSKKALKHKRLNELYPKLQRRGYPEQLIKDAIQKAKGLDRKDLLTVKKKKNSSSDEIVFVSTYNPTRVDPLQRLRAICKGLKYTKATMPHKIIAARRQPPSLLRTLSLSKKMDQYTDLDDTGGTSQDGARFNKCTDKRCQTCPVTITNSTYRCKNGTTLQRNSTMDCKSRDLVYMIICSNCENEYIGETGQTLNKRMNLHRSDIENINKPTKLQVSKHLKECAADLHTKFKFKIFPFHKCQKQSHYYREVLERDFRKLAAPSLH